MSERFLLAIDPGRSGGLAWSDPAGRVVADAMPDTPGGVVGYLREVVATADGPERITCYLEQVGGYVGGPGQPGSAMFRFGEGFGFLHGCLLTLGVSVVMVHPQRWQKAMALGTRGDLGKADWKRKLRATAERLFPAVKVTMATADALLLLHYARQEERRVTT